jgi:hypothetical protein
MGTGIDWWQPFCSFMMRAFVVHYGVPGSPSCCEWIVPGTENPFC